MILNTNRGVESRTCTVDLVSSLGVKGLGTDKGVIEAVLTSLSKNLSCCLDVIVIITGALSSLSNGFELKGGGGVGLLQN